MKYGIPVTPLLLTIGENVSGSWITMGFFSGFSCRFSESKFIKSTSTEL